MDSIEVRPIGIVRSTRAERLDDDWDAVTTAIELDASQFSAEVLWGLAEFSHVEVIFVFDRLDPGAVAYGSRHPRGNPAWPKVGIFAQRSSGRPNRLGTTVCRILAVDGLTVTVSGLDAVDGSPVLDLKPYFAEFAARGEVRQPPWSRELMAGYWRS
jgi:tRNA-Thr(GGU) m(6)t(6)A37 methyltransferase TsaA